MRRLKHALLGAILAVCGVLCAGPAESTVRVGGFNYHVVMKGMGSGFVVAPETVVTAAHVARMGTSLRVQDPSGKWHDARVVKTGKPDWAVLHVGGLKTQAMETASYVRQSAPLTAYGRFREGLRYSQGASSSWVFQGAYGFATTKVYPGYSGGPVVDTAGRAIGVVSMQTPSGNCLYVPISLVQW